MTGFTHITAQGNAMKASEIASMFGVAISDVTAAAEQIGLSGNEEPYSIDQVVAVREQMSAAGVSLKHAVADAVLANCNLRIKLKTELRKDADA